MRVLARRIHEIQPERTVQGIPSVPIRSGRKSCADMEHFSNTKSSSIHTITSSVSTSGSGTARRCSPCTLLLTLLRCCLPRPCMRRSLRKRLGRAKEAWTLRQKCRSTGRASTSNTQATWCSASTLIDYGGSDLASPALEGCYTSGHGDLDCDFRTCYLPRRYGYEWGQGVQYALRMDPPGADMSAHSPKRGYRMF